MCKKKKKRIGAQLCRFSRECDYGLRTHRERFKEMKMVSINTAFNKLLTVLTT